MANLDISVETLYKKSNVKVINDQINEIMTSIKIKIYHLTKLYD